MLAIITFWSQSVIKSAIRTSGLPAIKTTMDRHFVREARKKVTPSNEPKRNSDERNCQSGRADKWIEDGEGSEGIRSFAAVIIWHNYWLSLDDSTGKGARAREKPPPIDRYPIHVLKLYTYSLRGKCFATRFRMQSGFRSVEF